MSKPPQTPNERIIAGQPAKPAKQRAQIIMPGQGGGYSQVKEGGVNTQQTPTQNPVPPKPAVARFASKPAAVPAAAPAKPKPAPKRAASSIVGVKSDAAKPAAKPAAPAKPAAKPVERNAAGKPKKSAPMPGRKIPTKTKKRLPSPEEQTQELAQSVVTGFTDRLTQEAQAKGGSLTIADIQAMNKEFEEQTKDLKGVLDKSFEEYVTAREKASWSLSRKFPFDRMIVKTFSYMLEDDGRKLKASDSVSRRMLPGFFMALSMILGPDKLEGYQGKCRAVVKIVKKAYGDKFEWEDVYESDDARAILIDALIDIAHSFDDIEMRAEWFVDMINSHLPPPDDKTTQTEADWVMTMDGFKQFFKALMSDLNDALESEGGRLLVTHRHGVDETIELVEMLQGINVGLKTL